MRHALAISVGKAARWATMRRGGGSAAPGLVAERIDPGFLRATLGDLPYGVVVVSGTNGKTTTTKIVVELLQSQGLRVFTNRTGSNFSRGVVASLLGEVDRRGRLAADIAVLELDEAHAISFIAAVPPRYSLLLNVMRDQLDRFGEIDHTARLLHKIAAATQDTVVVNGDDPRIGVPAFAADLTATVRTFDTDPSLHRLFPSDDALYSDTAEDLPTAPTGPPIDADDTRLVSIEDHTAVFGFAGQAHTVQLQLEGVHNYLNAAAAIGLTRAVVGDRLDTPALLRALAAVKPAFGRGETIMVDGQPVELVLVKNPAGFRLSLASFDPTGVATMIVINDDYADGRDVSWLWDVGFERLRDSGVAMVSGHRCWDMALRLHYDQVGFEAVQEERKPALDAFLAAHPEGRKRIFVTYTVMLQIRDLLGERAYVEARVS
ncbi:UDP-N-acetylmuramyl tripeptide synthase [Branchiibius hedensis]|uniref:Lipid II isoglutaminyl synthase (glutamine-hydrolyzing) subunit MurT n=2 Tax=Branchiibius hedensis TaxID=672460 RepID=A0A2Y9C0X8_9MICO|nr:Mur ligase family protein [Branchiibius hedensis]PWJ24486.1 UDP-N-acetylmuramyl tripeptide synthase [Branchiibius hedensis]SSA33303.1 UDP-N-acetylmuramyl tripeptide synthase [Branchiibius hedensis]